MKNVNLKDRIKILSREYNFRASPVLDQIFIIDFGLAERAVKYAQLSPTDVVLEIGPGLGFLTEHIARNCARVIAVEKDRRLEPILKKELGQHKNIEYIFDDFLNAEIPPFNKIISNIPYSISAPLTFKLLDYKFDLAILFYQREFAEKMCSAPGENYGRLSVTAQYYFEPKIMEIVNKSSFYPMPLTDAAIVVLKPRNIARNKKFEDFVREIFRYPNKDVRNAVKISFDKEIADNRKVRDLSIPELKELCEKVM